MLPWSVRLAPLSTQPEAAESLGVLGEEITSPQNALVKRASSLRQRKYREREGVFLVEGADLVLAGVAAGRRPQVVFVQAERAAELAAKLDAGLRGLPGAPPGVFPVSARVAEKITTLETPPDVMAVFPLPEEPPLGLVAGGAEALVVYADGIGDPGNMGTLVRAAAAFGAAALIASPGSADLYGPKTVRAGMGAVFGLPLYPDVALGDALARLRLERVYGLAAHEGAPLAATGLRRPAALVVGAERAGISAAARRHVSDLVTIPLAASAAGIVESLNAGVAGAIALYEFSRRAAGAPAGDPTYSADPAKG